MQRRDKKYRLQRTGILLRITIEYVESIASWHPGRSSGWSKRKGRSVDEVVI